MCFETTELYLINNIVLSAQQEFEYEKDECILEPYSTMTVPLKCVCVSTPYFKILNETSHTWKNNQ